MDWKPIIDMAVTHVFIPIVTLLTTFAVNELRKFMKRKTAESRHWAKAGIFTDALHAILPDFLAAIKDGKLDDQEKKAMLIRLVEFAAPRIQELAGVTLDEFKAWAKQELDIRLGELKLKLSPIGPNDTAVE